MTYLQALENATRQLGPGSGEEARLEAEALLRQVLCLSRAQLYSRFDLDLTSDQTAAFNGLVQRRLNREPVAYIRGFKEFYGLEFYVDRRVLIPRPETELLVEKAIEWIEGKGRRSKGEGIGATVTVADVGTGSGCIAVSLTVNLPEIQVYATDPSPQALEVASINCHRHGVEGRMRLLEGAMLDPLPEQADVITANLPYVRTGDLPVLPKDIRDYEPLFALDGGEEGLDAIRLLLRQAPSHLRPGGTMLLEIGCYQGEPVKEIALGHFPGARVRVFKDYAGVERVVTIETGAYS